eukprot:m.936721 g.936721  ORF g.936721 m.936721 type:complete len:418 (-) comp23811_c0_seq4:3697-4950(-)
MSLVADYGGSSSEDEGITPSFSLQITDTAPSVAPQGDPNAGLRLVGPTEKAVFYNPTYEELCKPTVGPQNPNSRTHAGFRKNAWNGHVEAGEVSEFQFEDQRRSHDVLGYALDPSASADMTVQKFVGDKTAMKKFDGNTFATTKQLRQKRKRKDGAAGEDGEAENPWAEYLPKKGSAKPNAEQMAELDSWKVDVDADNAKKNAAEKQEKTAERSVLHIKDEVDYLGRTYMHPPSDEGKMGEAPAKCFLPKREIHKWTGHTKGVNSVLFLPKTGHLMLSCSMDQKIKLWEFYGKRRVLRTFHGHTGAVREAAFNNAGSQFVSAGYDRMVRLWDTETGECISRFSNKKIPYCVKFHPAEDKQNLFCCGTSDKKILCYDIRSGEVVQEYDRHLGAVNSITFVEEGRRMVRSLLFLFLFFY